MAVGPSGPALRPGEEEWKEVFDRLRERFPTMPPHRVAQVLREHNGHAGEAAAMLRDLSGSTVKEADPDDVEHVATLLSSPSMFKHACKEQFRKFDVNGDGVLEWEEVKSLVNQLYDEFGLQLPSEGSLRAFFYATDENQDGVLSEREFRKFFEMFLRYAFFDHLKLRQMVEKGQAIEEKRRNSGAALSEAGSKDDGENSRASSANSNAKPESESRYSKPATPEDVKIPKHSPKPSPELKRPNSGNKLSKTASAPTLASAQKYPARSPSSADKERNHRSDRTRAKERHSRQPAFENETAPQLLRCIGPSGVAYRKSPDYQDRIDQALTSGATVRVLEHWVRTTEGWLPMMDPHGQALFERLEPHADEVTQGAKKRVSIAESDDTLAAEMKNSSRSGAPSPKNQYQEAEGGGLRGNEEEWRPVFERLSERFPNISTDKIAQALRDNDGHAGKAASMLRYM